MTAQRMEAPLPASPPRMVEIERIESALSSMWSEAREPGTEGECPGVTRACTLNFLVYATPADDREVLADILAELNHDHPSRTLLVVADRAAGTPRIEAYISMRCRLVGGTGKQVCGEEVTIEADGPRVEAAASAVEALLVPGVPVYLWWKDIPHGRDALFERLVRMADRLVIDSAKFDHPADDLARVAAMIRDPSQRVAVSDLNWGRLTAWFELLTGLWDVPDYRPVLAGVDRITLAYRPLPGRPRVMGPRPLMLAGWLVSRLGLTVSACDAGADPTAATWRLAAGTRAIELAIRCDMDSERADARIATIELARHDGSGAFHAHLAHDNSRITTEAHVNGGRSLARVLAYTSRTDADRLSDELAILRRDAVYEAAMVSAGELVARCPRLLTGGSA